MDYFKLFYLIIIAVVAANLLSNAIINVIEHQRTKEIRELEKEKLRLEIELKKRTLKL